MEEQLVVLVDPWRDKYDRLLEAHEKLQKLNQNLEEKLLNLVEDHHVETTRLTHQAQVLTQRLVEARIYIHQLEDENDRYRSDINVVVQLLHCKPSNFVSPKLDTLPDDLQRKVLSIRNGSNCKKEKKIIKVQVPTFPTPTDIMYAVDKGKGKKKGEKDIVSAAIMAKILEERENERKENQKNRCKCASHIVLPTISRDTQTLPVCTISYSNFNFSDFEEPVQEDEKDEGEDEVCYDLISRQKTTYAPKITAINNDCHDRTQSPSTSEKISQASLYKSVDDIMKPDQKEEELLPTPLFRRKEIIKEEDSSSYIHKSEVQSSEQLNSPVIHQYHHINNQNSFPSPSSMSSASPVSSTDIPHSSLCSGSNDLTNFSISEGGIILPSSEGLRSSSSSTTSSNSTNGNRKVPGRPVSMNFHKERERGWEKLTSPTEAYRNGLVSHWRSTVLVHHPPKSHSYEPLSLMHTTTTTTTTTTTGCGESGKQNQTTTTFGVTGGDDLLIDSPSDEQPLLIQNNYANTNAPLIHSSSQANSSAQYYRAQKRTFWTRSSSTTSTETEI